tara:strand:- start:9205 stop:9879 length:675 start_codon:yes stop_codon:yes gene_type:complete
MRQIEKLKLLGNMRVGITQRVEFVSQYSEARDCLDHRWSDLLKELKMTIVPIPNALDKINDWLNLLECDAYILTGGNDLMDLPNAKNTSINRDQTEIAILKYAQSHSLPVLGVCRGLQLINVFFGGTLERVTGQASTRHFIEVSFDSSNNFIKREVNSFHEWGISKRGLSNQLIPCAFDVDGYVEAARHKTLNWLGIMWHPEREKTFDELDLEVFRKLLTKGFA